MQAHTVISGPRRRAVGREGPSDQDGHHGGHHRGNREAIVGLGTWSPAGAGRDGGLRLLDRSRIVVGVDGVWFWLDVRGHRCKYLLGDEAYGIPLRGVSL